MSLVFEIAKTLMDENASLKAQNAELKAIIKEMITAIDGQSNFCADCVKMNSALLFVLNVRGRRQETGVRNGRRNRNERA